MELSQYAVFPIGWLLACVALVVLIYAPLAVYRLHFHPLAEFPGPRLVAVTQWYEVYCELFSNGGGQFTRKIREFHQEYGPIVRVGPNELSVNDAAFHDQLYAPQPAIRDKYPPVSALLGTTKGTFSTIEHNLHRRRRNANSPFFSIANLEASEALIEAQVGKLCDLMWSLREKPLDLRIFFAAISFDSFYQYAFGVPIDLLKNLAAADRWDRTVEAISICAPFIKFFPWVMGCARRLPHSFLRALSPKIAQVFDLHSKIFQEATAYSETHSETDETFAAGPDKAQPETLFSVLNRSKLPKVEKTSYRISQEGIEMFAAAFTPARAMSSAMFYLHATPSVLFNLREELDSTNTNLNAILSFKILDKLPYLDAVTKEILRITFPVGTRLPLICREDLNYGEWVIPAGTPISVNTRDLLFDPSVFPEPRSFRPGRWLGNKRTDFNEKRYFCPWGKGSRMCPGRDFATREIKITLATILQRFEFELVDTNWERDIAIKREPFLTAPGVASNGVRVKVIGQRKHSSHETTH